MRILEIYFRAVWIQDICESMILNNAKWKRVPIWIENMAYDMWVRPLLPWGTEPIFLGWDCVGIMATGDLPLREETLCLRATLLIHSSEIDSELVHSDRLRQIQMDPSKHHHKSLGYFLVIMFYRTHGCDVCNKGIGDAGSTADIRMLWPWSALVCLGLL